MFVIGFPLLVVVFAIYNIIAFLTPGLEWTTEVMRVRMVSGADWVLTAGDLLVAVAMLCLFVEIAKATRLSTRMIVDHMLSLVLFVGMLVEFLLVKQAATATFFLLLTVSFIDVIGGFTISIRTAQRDVTFEGIEKVQQG
jgi:hypothetical protein